MVSFSCENCGDVLTKKKLDPHRNQCRGASFTCIDCMMHFQGFEYRAHTSCISEEQKYQGALYREKSKRKSVTIADPKHAYIEDVLETEESQALAVVDAPPRAPSPPNSAPMDRPDVFSFLVTEETPNASRTSLQTPKEQMQMVKNAQSLFTARSASSEDDSDWSDDDVQYGAEPVPAKQYIYETPAPKVFGHEKNKSSTDKKRKRQVEELDLTQARRSSQELDEDMPDVDTNGRPILHSGLTGGLNRMLSTKFPPSPADSGESAVPSPSSPAKRKRATIAGTTVERRGRAANGQLVKVRKTRRASDESRPRKHHRPQKTREDSKDNLKAIEYHRNPSPNATATNQLVVYKSRAEMFLSFVTKGPDSENGYSMNKALKRYHRERGEKGSSDKQEEEKELFKCLRLKKNERGEVVVFFGDDR